MNPGYEKGQGCNGDKDKMRFDMQRMYQMFAFPRRTALRRILAAGAAIWISASISGCSILKKGRLEDPYDSRTGIRDMIDLAEGTAAIPLFAEDLCVVTDSVESGPDITAEADGVFSVTDRNVICAKNPFARLNPASVTKIMTALIAVKYGILEDEVIVNEQSVITESGATLADIKPGDVLTLRQLLYGLMLPSGNDAANAIAVHMTTDVSKFCDWMNEEARALGATGTHFTNPHGLTDPDHYTTAYDLYLIFQECLKYPEFREVIQTLSYEAQYRDGNGNPVVKNWKNSNWYLAGEAQPPAGITVLGGKTGTTNAAGYCLILASQDEENREYISVILKAESRPGLYENMTNIMGKIVE